MIEFFNHLTWPGALAFCAFCAMIVGVVWGIFRGL